MYKDITFLLNPSEITAGTRGASLGPFALITAARKNKSKLFGQHPVVCMSDSNALLDKDSIYKFAKNIDGLVSVFKELGEQMSTIYSNKSFPFLLSGDHGSAGGTIAAIKKNFPEKRLGVVWIDAHGDIHSPYTTPSGNMHGMPLSTVLNEDNLPCKVNDISPVEKQLWDELKNMHEIAPKINPEDLVFVSVRDTEEQEDAVIARLAIKNYSVSEVRTKTAKKVVEEILTKLAGCELIYVSFDVDSMDPEITSHGTGTPVKDGLYPDEALEIMKGLVSSNKVCCIEFVEINPCLDEKQNEMAEVAYEIVEKLVKAIIK
jgi:arginase